jgi:hypothetical protein
MQLRRDPAPLPSDGHRSVRELSRRNPDFSVRQRTYGERVVRHALPALVAGKTLHTETPNCIGENTASPAAGQSSVAVFVFVALLISGCKRAAGACTLQREGWRHLARSGE